MTKADLADVKAELKADIANLRVEIANLKADLIKWMVGMMFGTVAATSSIVLLVERVIG